MSFKQFDFDPRIVAGINHAGYLQPTPIQQQAIPEVLSGRDVLAVAQTGTGKTAAFMLPILQRLTGGRRGRTRALVIAPTRELAEQIHQTARDLGRRISIRSVSVYGGVSKRGQADALRRGAEIVVACPGRLLDLIHDGGVDLSGVEVLVLDEADRMCDMGFLPDVRRILGHLPRRRQTLFFGATMPPAIRALADGILVDPVAVEIGAQAPAATVTQSLYPTNDTLKFGMLLAILKQLPRGRVLVFARTKYRARDLAVRLGKQGHSVSPLHGNMLQDKRQEAIDGFRNGKYSILVATDIAARGIDVLRISHVINYDMPDTLDAYTHRIGRTGRALRTGEALTFASYADTPMVKEIEKCLQDPLERRVVNGFDYGNFRPDIMFSVAPKPSANRFGQVRRAGPGHRAPRRGASRFS